MIAFALAVVLAQVDAGTDAGFTLVILDVNRGALWLNLPDGGVTDEPRIVHGGSYADEQTTMLLGQSGARGTAERAVSPDVDVRTLTLVGAVLFAIGVAAGFVLGWQLR